MPYHPTPYLAVCTKSSGKVIDDRVRRRVTIIFFGLKSGKRLRHQLNGSSHP